MHFHCIVHLFFRLVWNPLAPRPVFSRDTQAVGIARLGQADQVIAVASLAELAVADLGAPLHSLVIPGATHFLEDDMLKFYREKWAAGAGVGAGAAAGAGQ